MTLTLAEAKLLFTYFIIEILRRLNCYSLPEMAGYYVIFNGKAAGIYLSWHECGKHVLGVRNAIYQKYSTYEEAVRQFEAAKRDVNPNLGEPEPNPHDAVPLLGSPDHVAASTGAGNHGCSKVVLIICVAILLVGLWLFMHLCL